FREVLNRKKELAQLEIARDEMTMAEKIAEIKALIRSAGQVRATALFESARSRREMVLIFLGILELVKELVLRLTQSEQFGEIILAARDEVGDVGQASSLPLDPDGGSSDAPVC